MSENLQKKGLAKSYASTYLYNLNNAQYEKNLIDFIMHGQVIDKKSEAFQDIRYDIKRRQVSSTLLKVLDSDKVVLMTYNKPLPKAFKTFVAKDIRGDKKLKVFIDCDVVNLVNGVYKCNNIDILIAYLVSAMNQVIYYADPKRLVTREEIIKNGSIAFSSLFTNIIDYLYKISGVSSMRDKIIYLSSLYYQVNILGKELTPSVKTIAKKNSGLSDREAEVLFLIVDDMQNVFLNINTFINFLSDKFQMPKLNLDVFLEKWVYLYGVGTQFALEMYPAFATMMTNVYVGCYLNNQKTIEKLTGRNMVEFANGILKVGSESV